MRRRRLDILGIENHLRPENMWRFVRRRIGPEKFFRLARRHPRIVGGVALAMTVAFFAGDRLAALQSPPDTETTAKRPRIVSAKRLLPQVEPPAGEGGYKFLATWHDKPVTWDPCRPIHYVINTTGAPPGGVAAVEKAVKDIEAATGLDFRGQGTTTEQARPDRPLTDQRYGLTNWSPVIIDWVPRDKYPGLKSKSALAEPYVYHKGKIAKYVTGTVALNEEIFEDFIYNDPDPGPEMEAIIRHELGHVAGADHVPDSRSLMYRRPLPLPDGQKFSLGDRRGLARLGAGACHNALP